MVSKAAAEGGLPVQDDPARSDQYASAGVHSSQPAARLAATVPDGPDAAWDRFSGPAGHASAAGHDRPAALGAAGSALPGTGATQQARATIRDAAGLIAAGLAPLHARTALETVAARYAIAVSPAIQDLIAQAGDPIGRQFLPDPSELVSTPHELLDPIGDDAKSPIKGIVHRYADRALLKPLLVCPVYCRFCFRREHVGPDGGLLTERELEAAFAWIAAHPTIREVILTGGDPLMLSPRRLAAIVQALSALPSVETIRVHSRVPVADPERLSEALAASLETDRAMWLVVHANHASEFTPQASAALRRVQSRAIPVLGQSVLLRGVNDSEAALEALFRAMVRARVKPYYLHQLDAAPGTSRFHVPVEEGRRLLSGLRGRVTGLAWPTYVLDIPGGYGKVPIGPDYLVSEGSGAGTAVRDPTGDLHPLATEGRSAPNTTG